jgi:hypothetical protein
MMADPVSIDKDSVASFAPKPVSKPVTNKMFSPEPDSPEQFQPEIIEPSIEE